MGSWDDCEGCLYESGFLRRRLTYILCLLFKTIQNRIYISALYHSWALHLAKNCNMWECERADLIERNCFCILLESTKSLGNGTLYLNVTFLLFHAAPLTPFLTKAIYFFYHRSRHSRLPWLLTAAVTLLLRSCWWRWARGVWGRRSTT